ncbi:hypothetical protein [Cupriavidus sp. amp6]|uniref:hypothetical protein n=1 Tax=Cupriavidus sp. amp6 TaxID=388051 RepID=UPI0006843F83|nr:hypothetical protein [Cupriavidus sp. amp6]
METSFIMTTKKSSLPIGTLEELQSLETQFKQARGLPGNLPMLTCPIAKEQKHLLGSQYRQSNLGFGCIELGDGSKLQTIRFQMGDLQFYWVADMVDPEVWSALDMWRSVGRIPLLFRIENGDSWDVSLGVAEAPTGVLRNEAYRSGGNSASTASTVDALFQLVSSGVLQAQATTDIPGVPLRHVFVNVLVTKRVSPFVEQYVTVGPGERKNI